MNYYELAYRKLTVEGGFSLNNFVAEPPPYGYMYSDKGGLVLPLHSVSPGVIRQFFRDNHLPLANPNTFIGGWVDRGLAYLDVSHWTTHASVAWNMGIENQQLTIWDCETETAIPLPQSSGHLGTGGVQSNSAGIIFPWSLVVSQYRHGGGQVQAIHPTLHPSPLFRFELNDIDGDAYRRAERWAIVEKFAL